MASRPRGGDSDDRRRGGHCAGSRKSRRARYWHSRNCERRPGETAGRVEGAKPPASDRPRPRRAGATPACFRRGLPASKDFPWRKRESLCCRASTRGVPASSAAGVRRSRFTRGGQAGSWRAAARYSSPVNKVVIRRKTSQLPVGRHRRVGVARSPGVADASTASCRRSRAKSRTEHPAVPSPGESVTIKQLLSGHQARTAESTKDPAAHADLRQFALRPA